MSNFEDKDARKSKISKELQHKNLLGNSTSDKKGVDHTVNTLLSQFQQQRKGITGSTETDLYEGYCSKLQYL